MVPSSSLRKQRSYFKVEGQKVMGAVGELELLEHFEIGNLEHVLYNSETNTLHIIRILT